MKNIKNELIVPFWIIYTAFMFPALALSTCDLIVSKVNNNYSIFWVVLVFGSGIGFFWGIYNLAKWAIIQSRNEKQ